MKGLALVFAVAVASGGCTRYFGGPTGDDDSVIGADAGSAPQPDALVSPPPATCSPTLTLALGSHMFDMFENVTLTEAGTTYCIRLDTTARTHPTYFEARTPMQMGTSTVYGLALFSADDQHLATGYDAPLVITPKQTYQTVEIDIDKNAVFDVKLVAWSRSGSQTTTLSLSLYQIID
ncbi:MAG TPA: hypothetical protein VL326_10350 [Kofleriaceae bacterium]|nr:hypothetical protein [Kofleriaceae bacterium]